MDAGWRGTWGGNGWLKNDLGRYIESFFTLFLAFVFVLCCSVCSALCRVRSNDVEFFSAHLLLLLLLGVVGLSLFHFFLRGVILCDVHAGTFSFVSFSFWKYKLCVHSSIVGCFAIYFKPYYIYVCDVRWLYRCEIIPLSVHYVRAIFSCMRRCICAHTHTLLYRIIYNLIARKMCGNESASDEKVRRKRMYFVRQRVKKDETMRMEWSRRRKKRGRTENSTREDVTLVAMDGGWFVVYVCRLVSKLVVLRGQIRCTMKK